jgi:hypothetical protein
VTARTLILPDKRLPCGHFPICRFHGHDAVFRAESVHFSRAVRIVFGACAEGSVVVAGTGRSGADCGVVAASAQTRS